MPKQPANLLIEDMQPWHVEDVLKLEALIPQHGDTSRMQKQREDLIRAFLRYRDLGQAVCRVLEADEEKVIGYYILLTHPARVASFWKKSLQASQGMAYLAQIAMDEEFQQMGLGKILLRNAEESSRNMGLNEMILEVMSGSDAHTWYQHHAYEEIGAQIYLKKALA